MSKIEKTRQGRNGGKLLNTKKGDPSPNPKGKPKGTLSAKTVIKKWLATKQKTYNPITNDDEILTLLDSIVLKQILKADKGDVASFNALLDRTEGKPTQPLANDSEHPLMPATFKLPDGTDIQI